MTTPSAVRAALDDAHRREWASVLAATVRVAGSIDLAEEYTQEAFASALATWGRTGVPDNPGAWLTTAARRKALDAHRRAVTLRAKLPLLIEPDELAGGYGVEREDVPAPGHPWDHPELTDDRLRLIFTSCHPALAREAQLALTLRLLCGVPTADIARLFLVSESTMAARVTRAKKKIAAARIPYRIPGPSELPDRLDAVLSVIHLLFTTGHTAPTGDQLVRPELVERAIDLGRMLVVLMPDEAEAHGLLGLMLLTDARRATRVDEAGNLILLADQDRSRWDRTMIAAGAEQVRSGLRGGRPGRFLFQAAIASMHARAPSYSETPWREIVILYDRLLAVWPSPVVALNRAVAVAMADGPSAGLAEVDALDAGALAGYHYHPAVRADLLRRLDRPAEAAEEYRRALSWVDNDAERRFLRQRLDEVVAVTSACDGY